TAEADNAGPFPVTDEESGDASSVHEALKVSAVCHHGTSCMLHVGTAGSARFLDNPVLGVLRPVPSYFRMRDAEFRAVGRGSSRVLDAADNFRPVARQRKMPGKFIEKIRPAFETGTVNQGDRFFLPGEFLQPRDEVFAVYSGLQAAGNAHG